MDLSWGTLIVIMLIGGAITAGIAQSKNFEGVFGWFVIGALFPLIGIIAVAVQKSKSPRPAPAPAGMWAVKCLRCNAVQNVPQSPERRWECWQCRQVTTW